MNIYKGIFLVLLISGCANQEKIYDSNLSYPEEFYCPKGYVKVSDGHVRSQMKCQCFNEDQIRRLQEQLRRMS